MDKQHNTQSSQEYKGYISEMSPMKRTLAGGTHFDIQLQDSSTWSKKVKLPGDDNYRKAKLLRNDHSPVKIMLHYNKKLNHYHLNSNEAIDWCNNLEVKFSLNPQLKLTTGASSTIESKQIDNSAAKQLNVDNTYYSIKAKG